MQKEQENKESALDSLLCPSFSVYSSNNLNDVAEQVIIENDHLDFQYDNDNFEFVAFQKTSDEAFFDHRRGNTTQGVFSVSKRHDVTESLIPLRELMSRDTDRRSSDTVEISIPPLSEMEDDLDVVPRASYCFWTPKSPMRSPLASPIKCKKSNSTGSSSSSSSSKRWKFLSLLRRSKSDVSEVEKSKVKSSGKESTEKNIAKIADKNFPVKERKIPAAVTAMEAFYLRAKEIKRKSYLPYKQELIGFHATIGRVHV
ncbi:uncharacterized protein LOC131625253 [Vicia villosa]|uniref:uncharacterized protein LOC131625253 n=1 Tax=Vicia villosa TaxID=3911 RepID=UPI00273B2A7B|nr:uncharacterized protein LOC131625253 [Vicia villosa]